MKQLKVRNERIQRWLDYWTGWRELVLVIVAILAAALFILAATKVSAM